jgi:hypothetical protein
MIAKEGESVTDRAFINILFNNSPIGEEEVGFLDEQVDTVYSILYGQQQYVVMETHIPSKTMRIVDGKKYALSIWAPLPNTSWEASSCKHEFLCARGNEPPQSKDAFGRREWRYMVSG